MNPYVSVITLGVSDLNRAKQVYSEGLGRPIQLDYPEWVSFGLNDGSCWLGLRLVRPPRIDRVGSRATPNSHV